MDLVGVLGLIALVLGVLVLVKVLTWGLGVGVVLVIVGLLVLVGGFYPRFRGRGRV